MSTHPAFISWRTETKHELRTILAAYRAQGCTHPGLRVVEEQFIARLGGVLLHHSSDVIGLRMATGLLRKGLHEELRQIERERIRGMDEFVPLPQPMVRRPLNLTVHD